MIFKGFDPKWFFFKWINYILKYEKCTNIFFVIFINVIVLLYKNIIWKINQLYEYFKLTIQEW